VAVVLGPPDLDAFPVEALARDAGIGGVEDVLLAGVLLALDPRNDVIPDADFHLAFQGLDDVPVAVQLTLGFAPAHHDHASRERLSPEGHLLRELDRVHLNGSFLELGHLDSFRSIGHLSIIL